MEGIESRRYQSCHRWEVVASHRAFNRDVTSERPSPVRDLGTQDLSNVAWDPHSSRRNYGTGAPIPIKTNMYEADGGIWLISFWMLGSLLGHQ